MLAYKHPYKQTAQETETKCKRSKPFCSLSPDEKDAVNPAMQGTKASAHYVVTLEPGESTTVRTRLWQKDEAPEGDDGAAHVFGGAFEAIMERRRQEADVFYKKVRIF